MGNDLFLNAESKKDLKLKTSFGNCFQNQNNKNKFDNQKKKQKIYMMILEIDLLELLSIH